MRAPTAMPWILPLLACAVIVAALTLVGWHVRFLSPAFERYSPLDPHGFDPFLWFAVAILLLLFIVPLISAAGLVILLLTHAARLESENAANEPSSDGRRSNRGIGAQAGLWLRRLAWEAPPALMATLATMIIITWALSFLIVLIVPVVLTWKALPGVALMIEIVDLFGMSYLVPDWVFAVASLLVNLSIAVFLYADAEPYHRPDNRHSGSNED